MAKSVRLTGAAMHHSFGRGWQMISCGAAVQTGLWMIVMAGSPLPAPAAGDPFFAQVQNQNAERLRELFRQLTAEAKQVREAWQ
ncbi:MAG: hypothetical protein DCC55_38405 [Chloroflexi bacterium]|nr:MAG: hypothetical protein DCC55_38405 [Chloroflexota bacterium]